MRCEGWRGGREGWPQSWAHRPAAPAPGPRGVSRGRGPTRCASSQARVFTAPGPPPHVWHARACPCTAQALAHLIVRVEAEAHALDLLSRHLLGRLRHGGRAGSVTPFRYASPSTALALVAPAIRAAAATPRRRAPRAAAWRRRGRRHRHTAAALTINLFAARGVLGAAVRVGTTGPANWGWKVFIIDLFASATPGRRAGPASFAKGKQPW
jgi:hypothetical protein